MTASPGTPTGRKRRLAGETADLLRGTIMLAELRQLLAACPANAGLEAYRAAIVNGNVLLKRTVTTRKQSLRALRELYALDPAVPVFRALRDLWDEDAEGQPLLALLCAAARDPLLRATAELVLAMSPGEDAAADVVRQVDQQREPAVFLQDAVGQRDVRR